MNTTLTKTDSSQTTSRNVSQAPRRTTRPKADIYETAESWLLVMDLPGVDESAADISLEKHVLTIKADVDDTVPEGFDRVHTEFLPRRFERSFRVPEDIDASAIEATVKNGVLRLTLPKSKAAQPLRVTVKAG